MVSIGLLRMDGPCFKQRLVGKKRQVNFQFRNYCVGLSRWSLSSEEL